MEECVTCISFNARRAQATLTPKPKLKVGDTVRLQNGGKYIITGISYGMYSLEGVKELFPYKALEKIWTKEG